MNLRSLVRPQPQQAAGEPRATAAAMPPARRVLPSVTRPVMRLTPISPNASVLTSRGAPAQLSFKFHRG